MLLLALHAPGITELFSVSIQTCIWFLKHGRSPQLFQYPKDQNTLTSRIIDYFHFTYILSKLLERHLHGLITDHLDANYPIAQNNGAFNQRNQQCLLY